MLLPNGLEWIAATFGIALLGAVPAPLSALSARPEQEAAFGLVGAKVILTTAEAGGRALAGPLLDAHPHLAGGDRPTADSLPELERLVCAGAAPAGVETWDQLLAAGAAASPDDVTRSRRSAGVDGEAIILFTSGTSGVPKAVVHGHLAPRVQPLAWARMQMIRPDERIFSSYPFCWSSGLARSLLACLSQGAPPGDDRPLPAGRGPRAARIRTGHHGGDPAGRPSGPPLDHPPGLRLPRPVVARPAANRTLAEPLGLANWRSTGYGLTETCTLVSASPADHSEGEPPGSVGRVLPGWTLKVTDPDSGATVRRGTVGQFRMRGPAVMARRPAPPRGVVLR